jgi:hypothetical protein
MAEPPVGGIPIVVVSFPGVWGKQRWVTAVPLTEMIAEVRKRIPADANAELSNRQLSQEQVATLNLRPGDVGLPRLARFLVPANGVRGWRYTGLPPTFAARGAAYHQVTGSQSSGDGRARITREASFRADGIGVCRRSSGGAEVTAGDAVRMIARGAADEAVDSVCNIIPHLARKCAARSRRRRWQYRLYGNRLAVLAAPSPTCSRSRPTGRRRRATISRCRITTSPPSMPIRKRPSRGSRLPSGHAIRASDL